MHATVVTLFPELVAPLLAQSVFGRAVRRGLLRVDFVNLRDFGEGRHRVVDDRPFGGGPGMVLKAEPVVRAVEDARSRHLRGARTIYLTPQGRPLDQALVRDLATAPGLVLLCGSYEGVDERAIEILRPEEVSIGDYVLSGGELAAMVDPRRGRAPASGRPRRRTEPRAGLVRRRGRPARSPPLHPPSRRERSRGPERASQRRSRRGRPLAPGEALTRTRARRPDLLAGARATSARRGPDPVEARADAPRPAPAASTRSTYPGDRAPGQSGGT